MFIYFFLTPDLTCPWQLFQVSTCTIVVTLCLFILNICFTEGGWRSAADEIKYLFHRGRVEESSRNKIFVLQDEAGGMHLWLK